MCVLCACCVRVVCVLMCVCVDVCVLVCVSVCVYACLCWCVWCVVVCGVVFVVVWHAENLRVCIQHVTVCAFKMSPVCAGNMPTA